MGIDSDYHQRPPSVKFQDDARHAASMHLRAYQVQWYKYGPCSFIQLHNTHLLFPELAILEPSTPAPIPVKTSRPTTITTSQNVDLRSPQIRLRVFVADLYRVRSV